MPLPDDLQYVEQLANGLKRPPKRNELKRAFGWGSERASNAINAYMSGQRHQANGGAPATDDPNLGLRVLAHLKRSKEALHPEQLAAAIGSTARRVRGAVEELRDEGYVIQGTPDGYIITTDVKKPRVTRRTFIPQAGERRIFGLVSDTHGASKHEQLQALHEAYDIFVERGITTVLHAGDITHGINVYKGQRHDLKRHSYYAQVKHVIETYPERDGITTTFITGNHDEDAVKNDSADPGDLIAAERPDMRYVGPYSALVDLGGLRVHLQHGGGGASYAMSYKLQKYLEQFPRDGTAGKPHFYALGHYHREIFLPNYQGIHALLPGAFEGRNHLLMRLGIYPKPACWIIDCRLVNDEVVDVLPTLLTFEYEEAGENGTMTLTKEGKPVRTVVE